jgi:hypothetical protein
MEDYSKKHCSLSFLVFLIQYFVISFLETLDISFNYFSDLKSVEAVVLLNRLTVFILYGNPVLGPTGEDPMFIYIEDLVDSASAIRKEQSSTIPDVEFITEIPRRRILKKGCPLGRFSLYRDFSVIQVDNDDSKRIVSKPWKKKGIITPFIESQISKKPSTAEIVTDFTFITNSLHNNATGVSGKKSLHEDETNEIADDVMKKIAKEMGLIGIEELNLFQDYVNIPSL